MTTEITLGKFIKLKDFTFQRLLHGQPITLYLPSEFVVDVPQVVAPNLARVYRMSHYLLDGRVVDYKTLLDARLPDFKGIFYEVEILLWEVWADWGSDGHVAYEHDGYMFLPGTVLPIDSFKKYPTDAFGHCDDFEKMDLYQKTKEGK